MSSERLNTLIIMPDPDTQIMPNLNIIVKQYTYLLHTCSQEPLWSLLSRLLAWETNTFFKKGKILKESSHFCYSAFSLNLKIGSMYDRSTSFFLMMFLLFFHSIKTEMDIASSDCIIVIVICFRSLLGKWVQNNINYPQPQNTSHFLLLRYLKRHLSCCSVNMFVLWQRSYL